MTERARYWQRHLDRWGRSGLSQAAYCRRHGLKAVTFAWWKRKLGAAVASSQERERSDKRSSSRKRASSRTGVNGRPDAKFVEVAMISPGMAAYEVVLSGGLVIRVPEDFDPDKVSQLLAAVNTAC